MARLVGINYNLAGINKILLKPLLYKAYTQKQNYFFNLVKFTSRINVTAEYFLKNFLVAVTESDLYRVGANIL